MKVRIKRTSTHGRRDCCPCNIAVLMKLPEWREDRRSFKSFEEYYDKLGTRWEAIGRNHQVHTWGISREVPQDGEGWYLFFKSLKHLGEFIKEYGECVAFYEEGEMCLEIYDDYRE